MKSALSGRRPIDLTSDRLAKEYQAGAGQTELAARYAVSQTSIYRWMRHDGIITRTHHPHWGPTNHQWKGHRAS